MRRIMTLVGTRPELIKMSRVIAVLDATFEHLLVHTGQNYDYELNQVFFEDLGIRKPDFFLEAAGEHAIATIATVMVRAHALLERERPEAVLIYGDTNSGLACLAAKRLRIPIFHFEAGNRCYDARVPEEINRKIIDHTSDVNFVLTEHARRCLLAEGLPADRIVKSGSHMQEVLAFAREGIAASSVQARLGLAPGRYVVVSAHREENVDEAGKLAVLLCALDRIAAEHGVPVIVSTHPRTRARMAAAGLARPAGLAGPAAAAPAADVRFLPPFGYFDYVRLQRDALCVVSDSGTLSEEAALLGFPAVTLRDAHERPEGQDAGAVTVVSRLSVEAILDAIRVTLATHGSAARRVPDYEAGAVSAMVARVISGSIDYVNRVVWSKP
ncbi:UDP-2,3-diacetamido-2,3-dideoxy-D-glucuronate 2-epimerase [Methylobacterium crusticola]|uniref:UDP-2,3-diacetamido-2,3-dideoxy-D-glucuronate 2-epimerase n=1 Tax=Methylobacterium crusticola TaxID=1697972 RepID=A0ABQ4QT77_9HYPH|nr:UDP-N-acetyl glucosamine 2-epimerase [Methylobacterium crusticola]GJD48523.1 UDP-2,3-diacetamido-2,3-dideoxy-D-glucuronate 2-epimerase [Methylobacterium crusticola]